MADTVSVAIVGAGFAGLAMANELLRAGISDFVILEKADRAGGVWRENTYPGAACDVPSPYYSFSYAPKPDWTRRYAGQAQIESYLTDIASRPDLRNRIRYGVDVTAARFEESEGLWVLSTADGGSVRARVFVPATGQLSRPAWPDIAGRERFEGTSFHSAQWRHEVDLRGRRVAVIGAGASVIQFVPRIRPQVAQLTLFQRSAPYILPKPDGEYRSIHHSAFRRLPLLQKLERGLWWTLGEVWTLGITGNRRISAAVEAAARWQLRRQVASAALREKLTPDYPIGCKRVLFANDYYPALAEPNVEVVTERIAEITAGGIRTADGVEHVVDVIIYGTGFATQEFLGPMAVRGRVGRELGAAWAEGARAHLGMTVPGFPNMFVMYGPNTNLGTGSIIYVLECQARYIRRAVEVLARNPGGVLEIRAEVEQRYDEEIQRRLGGSAWSGCVSWYKSASGRISSNWPGLVSEYSRRTALFSLADFHASAFSRESGITEATSS